MNFFDTLEWHGKSRQMLDKIIEGTPKLFRGMLTSKIEQWAKDQGLTEIYETTVFQAVEELAPPNLQAKILPELQRMQNS